MIHGYAILSINHEGKGKFYDLPDNQTPFMLLDIEHDWAFDMQEEENIEILTPDNQKDVLVMVFFSHHYQGGGSLYADDYEEWFEIESFQVMQENHEAHYRKNLETIKGLVDSNVSIDWLERKERQERQEEERKKVEQLIAEYEEFYDKDFEVDPKEETNRSSL